MSLCMYFSAMVCQCNKCIAVRKVANRYGNSHATWDHTVLSATRQRWHSRPYPSRSWYSLKRPGGMQGWVDLVQLIYVYCVYVCMSTANITQWNTEKAVFKKTQMTTVSLWESVRAIACAICTQTIRPKAYASFLDRSRQFSIHHRQKSKKMYKPILNKTIW